MNTTRMFIGSETRTPRYKNINIVNLPEILEPRYKIKFKGVASPQETNIDKTNNRYPILCGIKQTNINSILNPPATTPYPIEYIYRDSENNFYSSPGTPDNIQKEPLFQWNSELSGGNSPERYSLIISSTGDLIFVWRGDIVTSTPRRNPIVYPAGDYGNPVEVDFGEGLKPTAWLLNSGADYIYDSSKDYFVFGEYTRRHHSQCHLWKVQRPFTDPNSWQVKLSLNVFADAEHFHTANWDPFSGQWIATTGDGNTQVKVYTSNDDGETWQQIKQGLVYKVLNYVFTEDYVYWGPDNWGANHPKKIYRLSRDESGFADFDSLISLADLPQEQATYVTVYMHHPHGLLFLDRIDLITPSREYLDVPFWSFEDERLYYLAKLKPFDPGQTGLYGFRPRCTSFYQNVLDGSVTVGFDDFKNDLKVLTNGPGNKRINTLVIDIN